VANTGWRAVVLIAAACGACGDDAEPARREEPVIPVQLTPPRIIAPMIARREARWENVEAANCVFFSGPNGRDTRLAGPVQIVREPTDEVELRFVDANATFTGAFRRGELTLERRTDYNNYGDAWKTTETIRGQLAGGVMRTRYHYEECKVGDPPCPGTCIIDADLTFER
jgi:hypothetical protein